MRQKVTIACLFAAISFAGSAFAQGGTGIELDIAPGARQNGMGTAGVALADDATGVTWWNPAGLGFVNRSAIELTYAQLAPNFASDINYNYLSYVHPLEGWGAFGIGAVFVSLGDITQTNQGGTELGTFTANVFSPALYYGTRLLPDLSVGAALKYVRLQYAPNSLQGVGTTFAVDLGTLYRIPAARLSFGLTVQNLGPSVVFINEDAASPLSRMLKIGTAWEAISHEQVSLVLAGDYNQSLLNGDIRIYGTGMELRVAQQLAGRFGYFADPYGHVGDVTYGLGVSWGNLTLDYGTHPQARDADLDNVKKITLGYRF
jgi:type IX secretion system protein PorV